MSRQPRARAPGTFSITVGWATTDQRPGPMSPLGRGTGGANPSTDLTPRCRPSDDEQFRADVVRAISECRGKVLSHRKLAGAVQAVLRSRYPRAFISAKNPLAWCEAVDIWYCYRDGPFA